MPKKVAKSRKSIEKKAKPGPKADILKIDGNWIAAVDQALAKKRPAGGWPKPTKG